MPTPTPSLPSPRTWAADDLITVPRLRADVTNAIAFLAQKPLFIGQNNAGSAWGAGADNSLPMPVELTDAWNAHVASTVAGSNNAQVWAQVPGWYLARAVIPVTYASATDSQFYAGFTWVAGGVTQTALRGPAYVSSNLNIGVQVTDLIQQVNTGPVGGSGDWIAPTLYAGQAASLTATAGYWPLASVRWVCASPTVPVAVPPLTAVPSPITSAWMNANVRDTIRFLCGPPICRAVLTGSPTMANSSLTSPATVPVNSVTVDNFSGFSTSAFAYTAPVAGRYFVYGQHNLAAATGTFSVAAGVSWNGTPQWGDMTEFSSSSGFGSGASFTRRMRLAAGDTIKLIGAQTSGSSVAYASGANQSRLIVVWEGV